MEILPNVLVTNKPARVACGAPDGQFDCTTIIKTNQFTPLNILDYRYAVLHSPNYREKYAAFLKIDFPRVPYPKTLEGFQTLRGLGSQLRQNPMTRIYEHNRIAHSVKKNIKKKRNKN